MKNARRKGRSEWSRAALRRVGRSPSWNSPGRAILGMCFDDGPRGQSRERWMGSFRKTRRPRKLAHVFPRVSRGGESHQPPIPPHRRVFDRVALAVPSHYTEQMFNIVRAAKIFRIPWKFLSEMLAVATARGFVGIEIGGVKESLPLTTAIKARRTRLGLAQKPECPVLYRFIRATRFGLARHRDGVCRTARPRRG